MVTETSLNLSIFYAKRLQKISNQYLYKAAENSVLVTVCNPITYSKIEKLLFSGTLKL